MGAAVFFLFILLYFLNYDIKGHKCAEKLDILCKI